MAKNTYAVSNRDYKIIDAIFVALVVVFMLLIPFYRGLFFRTDYIPSIILVSVIFCVFVVSTFIDKSFKVFDTYMDVAALLIPAAYLISFIFAVNAKDALDMFLLYCSYFMLYKLTSSFAIRNEKYKNILINTIIISAFVLALTSILQIMGALNINGVLLGKRLYGLYQYANTTASVLGVGMVLTVNKLIAEKSSKAAVIYQVILTTLTATLILTLSRGAYLVSAVVLLLNFLLIGAKAKLKFVLAFVIALVSNLALVYKFFTLPEAGLHVVWIYYLMSIIASALITYLVYLLKNKVEFKLTDKTINIALVAIVAIIAGAAVVLFSIKEPIEYKIDHKASQEKSTKSTTISIYGIKPNSSYTLEVDVKSSVTSPRSYGVIVYSYDDAKNSTQIIKEFGPVAASYEHKSFKFSTPQDTVRAVVSLYNYESNSYTSYKNLTIKDKNGIIVKKMEKLKYVPDVIANRLADFNLSTKNASSRLTFTKDGLKIIKDYPLVGAGGGAWRNLYRQYQTVPYNTTEVHNFYVQYGTEVGIIGLASLGCLLVLMLLSMIKSFRAGSQYLYVYLAAMLLLAHSTIDFNLSLPAAAYLLWMLIGIISSDKNTPEIEKVSNRFIGPLVLVLSLVVIFITTSIYFGTKAAEQGLQAATNKDVNKSTKLFEKAVGYDKYNSDYRFNLASLYMNSLKETKEKKYADELMDQIALMRKYEPFNHRHTSSLCGMLLSIGKIEEASKLAGEKLHDEPLVDTSYTMNISANYEIANYYIKNNQIKEAIPYLEKVVEIKNRLVDVNKKLSKPIVLQGDDLKRAEAAMRTLEMIKTNINK